MSNFLLDAMTEQMSDEAITEALNVIKGELKRKVKQYHKEMKASGDSRNFLDEIEDAQKTLLKLAEDLEAICSDFDAEIFDPSSDEY